MIRPLSLLVALLFLFPDPSPAIVIRHDRDDARYRALADGLDLVVRVGDGMGTLVAPAWILTAAHVADTVVPGQSVRVAGRDVAIAEIVLHPDYARATAHRDLALVRLASAVTDVEPARLGDDGNEAGRHVLFVGDGWTGTGIDGPGRGPRIRRGAHNVVAATRPGWLEIVFDRPPDGEDLEGISGPGDSGGPALVRDDDGWTILGVSSWNDGDPICVYGSTEYYARVSDALDWIHGVMADEIQADTAPRVMTYGTDDQGNTTVRREEVETVAFDGDDDAAQWTAIGRIVDAVEAGDRAAYLAAFDPATVAEKRAAGDPVDGMFDFFRGATEARGAVTRFHPLPDRGIRADDMSHAMRPAVFHLADGTPGYLGLALGADGKITHMSLFVQRRICGAGADCAEGGTLEELRGGG